MPGIAGLVSKDRLVKTNGWMQLLNSGSFLLGTVSGASLYAIFPLSIVLMSDAAGALCMFFYAPLSSFYLRMISDYFKCSAMCGSAVELFIAIGRIRFVWNGS